jgi:hypothetical protein
MSNLIPTPRPDKNGVVVIRHMKPPAASHLGAASVPRPTIANDSERDRNLASIHSALEDVGGVRIKKVLARLSDDDLAMLRTRVEGGGRKWLDWVTRSFQVGREHCGVAMVECEDFFSACHDGANYSLSAGMRSVYEVIGEEPSVRPTQFNIENIRVEFLMRRLRFDSGVTGYGSTHERYRDIELLRSNLDVIEPALPFLSMVANAIPSKPFEGHAAVLDAAQRFASVPKDRFLDVHKFLAERGNVFDAGLVEQLIMNDTRALYDGLL